MLIVTQLRIFFMFFFFNDTATTEIYTLSLHDALPIAALTQQVALPGPFLRFIGVAEVLGALGLVLPGLLRRRTDLTPIAAAGLVIIMAGAVGVTMATIGAGQAVVPGVVGVLAAGVAVGRWRRPSPAGVRRPSLVRQAA